MYGSRSENVVLWRNFLGPIWETYKTGIFIEKTTFEEFVEICEKIRNE